jgi:hypothetical protein
MSKPSSLPGLGRLGVAVVPAGIGGALAYAVLARTVAGAAAGPVSLALALGAALWLAVWLPADVDDAPRRHRWRSAAWLAFGIAAIGATARLATFMVDERKVERSVLPFDDFFVHHSCLSAHFQSARLQREGVPNVYERTHYEGPNGEPKFVGGLVVDVFIYPPPFLLLSRLALALSEDFSVWRAVWFGIEGTAVAAGLVAVALVARGEARRRMLLLSPVVWLSVPVLTTLQFGNFHLVAVAGAMFAMLALERGHHALGGGLLAGLALAKVFPGILVLLLLLERRWRSLAWTAGLAVVLVVVAWVVLGEAPFRAMAAYNLPRLASGDALETQFAHPDTIAANHAFFGLVQKLSLLGVPHMGKEVAVAASWLYTGALVAAAAVGARVGSDPVSRALVWLALLQLASLRSPFTPDTYAKFPLLWILVLLLSRRSWSGWPLAGMIALLVPANYTVPTIPIMPLPALLALSLADQLVFLGLTVGVLAREGSRPVEAALPSLSARAG